MHAVQFGNLSRSDGSAIMCLGETIMQAAVNGPSEIKVSKEMCDKAVVEVLFKPKVGQSDSEERLTEYFIRNCLESVILTSLHPRTSINIIIQEVQDAGNMLACSINAACLAILDAGISMRGIVAAVTVGLLDEKLIPFPTAKEIKDSKALITICVDSPGQNVVGVKNSAFVTTDELHKSLEIAKKCAEDLFQFYRDSIEKRYQRSM